jgi:RND family efflux transporter MFP subunit
MPIDSLEERETIDRQTRPPQIQRTHKRKEESHPNVVVIALVLLLFLAVALWGIFTRHHKRSQLNESAEKSTHIPVSVVHPTNSRAGDELILPANVQAYLETPIYARTNGYLKKWYVDIGGRVKAGELLATIDTPDVDQEYRAAIAAQATATANRDLAKVTADRYQGLLKSDGVSRQEVDQNVSAYHAREADLQSANANVERLRYLENFSQVIAPFTGVITARNVDVGALIQNGTSMQLFRIAQTDVLRVYVNVPQTYERTMLPGVPGNLEIPEFPNQTFVGKVARTSRSIDLTSRTLLTEVDVPNPDGIILPGVYGNVHFHVQVSAPPLEVPSNTLIFRAQGSQVAVVSAQNTAHLQNVSLGRDLGTAIEVNSGLTKDDSVILNPPDSIGEGDPVQVTETIKNDQTVNQGENQKKGPYANPGDQSNQNQQGQQAGEKGGKNKGKGSAQGQGGNGAGGNGPGGPEKKNKKSLEPKKKSAA